MYQKDETLVILLIHYGVVKSMFHASLHWHEIHCSRRYTVCRVPEDIGPLSFVPAFRGSLRRRSRRNLSKVSKC